MSYGHAERNLATVRALCADTIRLLADRQELTPDEKQWLAEATAQPAAYGRQVGRADDAGRTGLRADQRLSDAATNVGPEEHRVTTQLIRPPGVQRRSVDLLHLVGAEATV